MREYNPKHPLERLTRIDPLNYWRCKNLLRDDRGNIISDNIAYFKSEIKNPNQKVKELETIIKECYSNVELVYHATSGNSWLFLIYNGNPSRNGFDQMQKDYEEVYDPTFTRWKGLQRSA